MAITSKNNTFMEKSLNNKYNDFIKINDGQQHSPVTGIYLIVK